MLSKNEATALAMALNRDLNRLDADLFASVIKGCKHWDFVRDQAIDDLVKEGLLVLEANVEAERQEREEKLSTSVNELEKAQAKIDDHREKLGYQSGDLDRIHEMIASRNVADALDLLRDMYPEHQFLSPAAEKMLAGIRAQGALAL